MTALLISRHILFDFRQRTSIPQHYNSFAKQSLASETLVPFSAPQKPQYFGTFSITFTFSSTNHQTLLFTLSVSFGSQYYEDLSTTSLPGFPYLLVPDIPALRACVYTPITFIGGDIIRAISFVLILLGMDDSKGLENNCTEQFGPAYICVHGTAEKGLRP